MIELFRDKKVILLLFQVENKQSSLHTHCEEHLLIYVNYEQITNELMTINIVYD